MSSYAYKLRKINIYVQSISAYKASPIGKKKFFNFKTKII